MSPHPTITTHPDGSQSQGSLVPAQAGTLNGTPVSCLMVTRGLRPSLGLAIDCYRRQSYAPRELVILCDGDASRLERLLAARADPTIRLVRSDVAPLGELRNRSVEAADGALFCQWDDDDLADPDRLHLQLAALEASGAAACFLLRWLIWWPALERLAAASARLWEGSMLVRREAMRTYPPLGIGEDFELVAALRREHPLVAIDAPTAYLYVAHGANTCSGDHFDTLWANASDRFEGERYAALSAALAARMPLQAYAAAGRAA